MKKQASLPYFKILQVYWGAMKKYPLSGIGLFILYAVGFLLMDVVVQIFFRDLFDLIAASGNPAEHWTEIVRLFFYIVLIYFIYSNCFRISDFMFSHHQMNVRRELQNKAFESLQKHSYHFFTDHFSGSLVAKARRFSEGFEQIYGEAVFNVWVNLVLIVGVFSVLLTLLPLLAYLFIGWCALYALLNLFFIRYRKPFDLKGAEQDSKVTGLLSDVIANMTNVKLFTSAKRELATFAVYTENEKVAWKKSWNINNVYFAFANLMVNVLELGGLWLTLKLWLSGQISPGTVLLVQLYFFRISTRTWEMGRGVNAIFRGLSDASEMVEIMQKPVEIKDVEAPELCRIKEGKIEFKKVYFNYEKGERIFSNFNLLIPAGQKVGLVGYSGAGKSSLFRILLRFMEVQKGQILIDGQEIDRITQDDLRAAISFVPQDPILFHRTLFENIAYSNPSAKRSEVIQAAKWAHAHEFIEQLPKKYNTLVGERGVKLSGGERQRIAIARAFLKKAPLLLLDEATSSLDSVSEKYIQENLKLLMEGKTTVAIAHRISTLQQMDRILVMEGGKIVEDGTHAQLLKKKGLYETLWSHQSNGFLVEE